MCHSKSTALMLLGTMFLVNTIVNSYYKDSCCFESSKKIRQQILTEASEVKISFMSPHVNVKSISLPHAKTGKRAKKKPNLHKSACKNTALSFSCNCYLCYLLKHQCTEKKEYYYRVAYRSYFRTQRNSS